MKEKDHEHEEVNDTASQERKCGQYIPYSLEVIKALARRRQMPHPQEKHWVPETPDQIKRSEYLTDKLMGLMQDEEFHSHRGAFMSIAQNMMGWGHITETQFLSFQQEWDAQTDAWIAANPDLLPPSLTRASQ